MSLGSPVRSPMLRRLLLLLCLLQAGCALVQADRQMKRVELAVYFTGTVETEAPARGPIVLVLYRPGPQPEPVFVDVVPRSRGYYHLVGPPGSYGILAFEDINRNLRHDQGEPAALYRGKALGLGAIDEPPSDAEGLGHIRIAGGASGVAIPPIFGPSYAALTQRRMEEFGEPTSMAADRFSAGGGREGLFTPLRFVQEGRSGLFMLEPFDPARVPVIFVHGIGGSPREWEVVIEKLDRSRFQPWIYYYPSGFSLGLSALMLASAIDELHYRHPFDTSVVVAHSMGGLVSRGALNIATREGRTPPVHHLVTISTPWHGLTGARWAGLSPTRVPGSWIDVAPESAYLHELVKTRRPLGVRHTLFFGFGGGSWYVPGNNDGTVALSSMLASPIQERADDVFGFDENHVSILRSGAMIERLKERLRQELDGVEFDR